MKTVLCFGDSNTWGYDPEATAKSPVVRRHELAVRWTGVLAAELGPQWRVIEEGQNGRTTVFQDPLKPWRMGRESLPVALESHQPIDLVVIMLGTNDLKTVFHAPAGEIAAGVGVLVEMVQRSTAGQDGEAPGVLVVAPPAVGDFAGLRELDEKFAGAREKSLRFPELYQALARGLGVGFLNAQEFTTPSPLDGLHLDAESHRALGLAIARVIRKGEWAAA